MEQPSFLYVATVVFLVIFFAVGIPTLIALALHHPKWDVVFALAAVGLIIPPLWLAAMLWAFLGGQRREPRPYARRPDRYHKYLNRHHL